LGEKVMALESIGMSDKRNIALNGNKLSSGIYLVKMHGEKSNALVRWEIK
jgi:hypothetical protein